MGTDRDLVHEGPCSCGIGKYIINICTPDHPYARDDQYSYDLEITCRECSQKYTLEVRGHEVFRVLRSEVEKKHKIEQLYHNKSKQIMDHARKKGYLQILKKKIEQLPTKSSIYRTLKRFLSISHTEGTFRKHFTDADKWVERNIFPHDMPGVMRLLGIKDSELTGMLDEMEKLWELSRQPPPVVDPAICKVPREGKMFLV